MGYILSFSIGLLAGIFIIGLTAGGGQAEREEVAYRCGYEQGKQDAEKEKENENQSE